MGDFQQCFLTTSEDLYEKQIPKEAVGKIYVQDLGDFQHSFLVTSGDFYERHLETFRRDFWRLQEEASGGTKEASGNFQKRLQEYY